MVDIQSPTAEIRRGKKKIEEERNYRMKILWSALLHRATIVIILNQAQVNLIHNTNRNFFIRIEIFISITDLYNTTVDRWSGHLPNRNNTRNRK